MLTIRDFEEIEAQFWGLRKMAKKDAPLRNAKSVAPLRQNATAAPAVAEKTRREVYMELLNRYVAILPLPFVQEFEAFIQEDFPLAGESVATDESQVDSSEENRPASLGG